MKRYYTAKSVGKYQVQRVMCITGEDIENPDTVIEGVKIWRKGSDRSYHYGYAVIQGITIDDFRNEKDVESALSNMPGKFSGWGFMIVGSTAQSILDEARPRRIHRCYIMEYNESNHDVLPEFNDYEKNVDKRE